MKRKALVKRERNGRAKRSDSEPQIASAAEVHRLRSAALAGMRDASWGTTLAHLYFSGRLSSAQFAAGKRMSELAVEYAQALAAPEPPRSARLERSASKSADPDTERGEREARRHRHAIEQFSAARALLMLDAKRWRAVVNVCEKNLLPTGVDEHDNLVSGLQALVVFWGSGRHKTD